MLHRDRKSRPQASALVRLFHVFSRLLSFQCSRAVLGELPIYLPYIACFELISKPQHMGDIVLHLSKGYHGNGDRVTTRILCEELIVLSDGFFLGLREPSDDLNLRGLVMEPWTARPRRFPVPVSYGRETSGVYESHRDG